jgi:protein TonB
VSLAGSAVPEFVPEPRYVLEPPPTIVSNTPPTPIPLIDASSIGAPVPVPDIFADPSLATNDEIARSLDVEGAEGAGQGSGVLELPIAVHDPEPGAFVSVEELPVLVHMPAIAYPELARLADVEGTVMVHALIGQDGAVRNIRVVSGVPLLNDAAVAAVRGARFRPALQRGKPVAVWFVVPVRFQLD